MIQKLEVKGLNNRLDGEFEFNEDLNIFTGPNGSGKTTLLKLIWYFMSGHLKKILYEIPFSYLSIETDRFSLTMDLHKFEKLSLGFKFSSNSSSQSGGQNIKIDPETKTIDQKSIEDINKFEKRIAESSNESLFFPSFRRIEGGYSIGSKNSVDTEDTAVLRMLNSTTEKLPTALSQLSDDMSTERHKFITSVSTMDIQKLLPQKYVDIYQKISSIQSQVLDKISKEMKNNQDIIYETSNSASMLLDAIKKVDKETEQLKKPISVLSELTQKILRHNVIRITDKLVLGETTDGFNFGENGDDIAIAKTNNVISSDKLSSGEKQMLSFLCYNAFSKNTAIFIDEPELSLHVDWQSLLLPTLIEQTTGNQFFVATHSPFIYTLYPDKEIMLGNTRGYQGET